MPAVQRNRGISSALLWGVDSSAPEMISDGISALTKTETSLVLEVLVSVIRVPSALNETRYEALPHGVLSLYRPLSVGLS